MMAKMIFGDLGGIKLPDICLTGEENPEKTSPRKLVPAGDRTRARCVTIAHATLAPQRWTIYSVVVAWSVEFLPSNTAVRGFNSRRGQEF